jgi:UDP-2-acetamido-3-amino-2,3-dideoxy-glucuronate N-acetyltransferase
MTNGTGSGSVSKSKVRVCVAGCGYWGQNLLRNFNELGALSAVCEQDAGRLKAAGERYPAARPYSSFREALADAALDAMVIASPAEMHFDMAMAALDAGKDVFVEKPMALEPEQGLAMSESAERRGRILMVGHLLQYHPAILKIRELLADGVLGRIEYIYSNRLSNGKIRKEENALWSFAPHDISAILALTGALPVQVSCTGGAYLQPNIADVTVSHLLFDRGTRAHIFVSWLHPYKEQRLVVIGSKQMVVFEDSKKEDKLVLFNKAIEFKNGMFESGKPSGTPVPLDAAEPLSLECQHFLHCVETRTHPRTDGAEGTRVLKVLQACQRSLQMNGEPVQVHGAAHHKILAL